MECLLLSAFIFCVSITVATYFTLYSPGRRTVATPAPLTEPDPRGLQVENLKFEVVPDVFLADDPDMNELSVIHKRFGLIDDSLDCWRKLVKYIEELNEAKTKDGNRSDYKVIFFGRPGQAYNNLALDTYGLEEWERRWSKVEGDGKTTWGPDAKLTSQGKEEALAAHEAWKSELESELPFPGRFYCSPLSRALETFDLTFTGLLPKTLLSELVSKLPFFGRLHRIPLSRALEVFKRAFPGLFQKSPRVMVLENCRERYGLHLNDKRRSRKYIEETFRTLDLEFENGFTEEDELWEQDVREPKKHVIERARQVLAFIFSDTEERFISITAHKQMLLGFRAAVGLSPRITLIKNGVVFPLLIKQTVLSKAQVTKDIE